MLTLVAALLLLSWGLRGSPAWAWRTEHVIIVVLDGVRYSEAFGDSAHATIPHLWGDLRPLGAINTHFSNRGLTRTLPGMASILTGVWETGRMRPGAPAPRPTLFEYLRKAPGSRSEEAWFVSAKRKLRGLVASQVRGYGARYSASWGGRLGLSYSFVRGHTADAEAADALVQRLRSAQVSLAVLHLGGPDIAAHRKDWVGYLEAIGEADSLVHSLWRTLEEDLRYRGRTTLVVTSDHGRHLEGIDGGFRSHGDACEGCQHVLFLAIGPDTPAGLRVEVPRSLIDIAPTVGALLGFPTPVAEGDVMVELLKGVD